MTVTTRKALDRVSLRSDAQTDSTEQEPETCGLAAGPGSRPEAETGADPTAGGFRNEEL